MTVYLNSIGARPGLGQLQSFENVGHSDGEVDRAPLIQLLPHCSVTPRCRSKRRFDALNRKSE